MRHKVNFLRGHKEFEPIYEGSLYNKPLIEEYKNKELNRQATTLKIVYDCMDVSPHYASVSEYIRSED